MKPDQLDPHPDVSELIEGCINKELKAQRILYERYAPKLYAVCLAYSQGRPDAEDTLHDGFMKIYNNIHNYKNDGSFEGWMRRIMVNTALEKYRRDNKMVAIAENIRYESDTRIEHIIEDISAHEIMEVIQGLTPHYRMCFLLYAVEGYSHKEIGRMLGISEGTSKSNTSRARVILQERLKEYYSNKHGNTVIIPMAQ